MPPPRKADVARVCGVLENLELGGNELVSLYRHPVLDTGSQSLSKGDDVAIADRASLVRNDGKQQTETNLSDKRSFASLKMTNNSHSEQREESYKLDCFTNNPTTAMRFPPMEGSVRNDETTLVPQYLSALVSSKRAAFTKPSRGTSDSERRTIINGNRAAWLSAINGFLCFATQNSNTLCRQSAFRFDCERCRLTRGAAFTLAEVLITLGIIGVVAAITMPTIMANVQKTILKNQFKSAYSKFSQAVFQTQARMGYPVESFYWTMGEKYSTVCAEKNEYGTCKKWTLPDGSPVPSDTTGLFSGCPAFEKELFTKTLKVVKFCQDHALANGCLTDAYRGVDKVKNEQNPDKEADPGQGFSDSNIKNNYSSLVLADGTVIIKYGKYGNTHNPTYTIDINGHKGPNKWGYDIFALQLKGDNDGIKKIAGTNYAVDKGGTSSTEMIKNAFSK